VPVHYKQVLWMGINVHKICNYYPYVEHEVLHTMGLLADDHSNWNDYKEIAKYL
jgi:hypothetical protein